MRVSVFTNTWDQATELSTKGDAAQPQIGKAGDPLPPFKGHMVRQRVTRHGAIYPLAPATELPGCCMEPEHVGVPKQGPVGRWLQTKQRWESKFANTKTRVQKNRIKDVTVGYETFGGGEYPPPSALAGRRRIGADLSEKKTTRSYGLSLWSLWGSKHDESTVAREQEADREPEIQTATAEHGSGARPFADIQRQEAIKASKEAQRSRSRRRIVRDERQTGADDDVDENTPVAEILARKEQEGGEPSSKPGLLTPDYVPDTGVTGKRPFVGGIAVPFSLNREADTASMVTLNSAQSPRPTSPEERIKPAADPRVNSVATSAIVGSDAG